MKKNNSFLDYHDLVRFLLPFFIFVIPNFTWADLSFSLDSQVHLQADTIQYLKDENLVMARGQVHIQQGSVHLYADSIRYEIVSQDVHAKGHVVWQDALQEVESDSMTYNLRTKKGKSFKVKTVAPPWITTGSEIDIENEKIVIKDAVASTCDYSSEYQHYSLRADKITIYSGDYLVAENVVLQIGKVPVFYFPFFVKTIHDVKTPFSFSTGSTEYLGNYILLTNSYFFSPVNYGAVYTDYFSRQGFGLGIRHEISLNNYSAFSLYGYGTRDADTKDFRWESRIRGLWAISSNLQGRVEADIPGDSKFSQDYSVARRDPSLISTVREYNISGTLSQPQYTFGLLLRRQETPDAPDQNNQLKPVTHFNENLQNLPQFNFSLFPIPLIDKKFLKFDLNVNGDHTYTKSNDYYVNRLHGEIGLSQSNVIFQTQTIYAHVGLNESFQDVSDKGVTQGVGSAGDTHSTTAQAAWTGRWSEYFSTNLTYNFSKKLNNLLAADRADGISANFLSGSIEFNSGALFRIRTSTSYDFASKNRLDGARLNYIHQELYLTPSPWFDYLGIANYSVQANALKDLNMVINYKSTKDFWRFRISGNFVDPNVSNTGYVSQGVPKTFELSGQVDLSVFTNYRISAMESYDCTNAKFDSRSISLYRDLHDWEAQLGFSQDPIQGDRLFFTLNLKALPGRPLTVSDQQLQNLNGIRNQGLTGSAAEFQ